MVIVAIVAVILFIWYTKKYTPEISRQLTKAFHKRGLPLFLQDEMGNVGLYICDKKFPTGVVHVKGKGWFLLPRPPNPGADEENEDDTKKVGRPSTKEKKPEEMSEKELAEYTKLYGIIVQTPILKGFGKQVFFGSTDSIALSNLDAISHADLPKVQWLAPKMYNKEQIDSLATGCIDEGKEMSEKDPKTFLMYCLGAALVIVAIIAGVWLLTQHSSFLLWLI